jgi:uncharacterized protein (TIGR02452 family)
MIKRSGVEIMNARSKNVSIAKETIQIVKDGGYKAPSGNFVNLETWLCLPLNGTRLYQDPLSSKDYTKLHATLEVTNETTTQAAVRLAQAGKTHLVALNFASARNPGGGFLAGALAQEEDLCRVSALYACLKSKPIFYNQNILCDDPYYTHNIIYSPEVPFFRADNQQLLEEPFQLSIISAPAPNLSGAKQEGLQNLIKGILRERALKILQVAEEHQHHTLILGAWGCGAYGNDPRMVSEVFLEVLAKVPAFQHVCFAVYDTRTPPHLFETFRTVIDG